MMMIDDEGEVESKIRDHFIKLSGVHLVYLASRKELTYVYLFIYRHQSLLVIICHHHLMIKGGLKKKSKTTLLYVLGYI